MILGFYPTLRHYTFYILLLENSYFVIAIGTFAILYGFIRAFLLQAIKNTNFLGAEDYVFIHSGKTKFRFKISSIKYLQAEGNYVRVVTENKSPLVYSSMNNLEERLPEQYFLRVHRSCIVSTRYIEKYDGRIISIDDKEITIGKTYASKVKKRLDEMVK